MATPLTSQGPRAVSLRFVIAGLVPAIHVFSDSGQSVDARDKPAHDDY
jgi:hypothetical protein